LRTDAVTTDKLTNSAVTAAKIADGVITTNKLASAAHQQLVKAWGMIDSAGTLVNGYGVSSVASPANGIYTITPTVAPGITNYVALATPTWNTVGSGGRVAMILTNTASAVTFIVKDLSGTGQNTPFVFQLIY
jgi:hypothetical protein